MQSRVKARQDYQGSNDTQQIGGGINRQSDAKGSASIARNDYQGGADRRADDDRRAGQTRNEASGRSNHRSGARGR